MPIVYGKGGCIRYMEVREQPLYDPDSPKEKAPPKCRGSRRGRPSVRVRCVETGVVFESITAAAKDIAVSAVSFETERNRIADAVKAGTTCNGFHWETACAERRKQCSS